MKNYKIFMKVFFSIALVLLNASVCSSNTTPLGVEWARTFGGSGGEEIHSVQQTTDGGYIMTGYTHSYGPDNIDFYLIKTDSQGIELWSKTFGGKNEDYATTVQQTKDGGYIVMGYTYSYGAGSEDVWLIKTDPNGNMLWSRTFGGAGKDECEYVQETLDGSYIIPGITNSKGAGGYDAWLIKTDPNGNVLWDKTFGGADNDWAGSVQQTTDGGYIMAAGTESNGVGTVNAWLIKFDPNGNVLWDKTFGGADDDWAGSVQQTTDGGYVVSGWTTPSGTGNDDYNNYTWLIKTDPNGNILWKRIFDGPDDDKVHLVQQTTDGGFILAGDTRSYGAGLEDAWLIKTDPNGNMLWNRTFGGADKDEASSVQQTSDGGYIVAGGTKSFGAGNRDAWLIKIAYPIAYFTYTPQIAFSGQAVSFDASGSEALYPSGNIVSYKWDFGDGNSITATNSTTIYTYSQGGNYTITLTITDHNGDTDLFSQTIRVYGEDIEWIKTFGGINLDAVFSVEQTRDGGYIAAGGTLSYSTDDFEAWLIKTDSEGNKLWSRTFGGVNDYYASSIQQTSDGGFIIAGGANEDAWLIKTDPNGRELWSNTFGGPGKDENDEGESAIETSDGSYILVAEIDPQGDENGIGGWLIKTDPNGRELWNKIFGGLGWDEITSVRETTDGGYILAGWTSSDVAGEIDVWLIKTDPNGQELWSKTFGGPYRDYASSVQLTADGGYIITGCADAYHETNYEDYYDLTERTYLYGSIYLIKTDPNGNEEWSKTFGGTYWDEASSVQQTEDGGYIIAGMTKSFGAGKADAWIIKTDPNGNKLWSKTLGGTYWDYTYSIQQTQDRGYIIAGLTSSYGAGNGDVWLIKIAPDLVTLSLPAGWSMISLPLMPQNASVSSLFPDALVVYGYEKGKGYVRVKGGENMEKGRGYWILINNAKTYSIIGEKIDRYNLTVQNGWYMIGGCTSDAKVSVDNGNIRVIYAYKKGSGYKRIQVLKPGEGYWILFEDVVDQCELMVEATDPNISL